METVKDLQAGMQPPDWVGDVIAIVVLIAVNQVLRSARYFLWKRMPSWFNPLLWWSILTILFVDMNIIRKIIKKLMPFVDHYFAGSMLTEKWLLIPLPIKILLWCIMTVICLHQAWSSRNSGPISRKQRIRAIEIVNGLYDTGYLMEEECDDIKKILNDQELLRSVVSLKILSKLRTIMIKMKTADLCPPCHSIVDVVLSSNENDWPLPLNKGPLQELGDVDLKHMNQAVRVWLRATQRDGKAKYVSITEIALELKDHFRRNCNAKKRELEEKDVHMIINSILKSKLNEEISDAGLKFTQYKLLWQWYDTVVAMINSDSTVQKGWDEKWIEGFVSRKETEKMLKESGEDSVLFRFTSDVNDKKKFNLCASVYNRNGDIVHSLIQPKPLEEVRFLIPTKIGSIYKTETFKTFKNIFTTYDTWKIFTPSGVNIKDVDWN